MSTIINATTTNGVVIQPDNSGSLVLQTNSGTTALTIDTSQRAAFVAGTAAAPAITTTGDTNTGIFFPAADTIAFAEGGAEAMRIDSSGNVGIGTTSPISGRALTLNNASNYYGIRFQVGGTSIAQLIQETTGFFYIDSNMNNESGGTIFRTGSTERMRIDSSGNLLFNSGYGSVATAYGCRAWVNFNGTGTVAIRSSGNVSSITDVSAGVYGVNFAAAMPDVNYSTVTATSNIALTNNYSANTTSVVYVSSMNLAGTRVDDAYMNVAIFR